MRGARASPSPRLSVEPGRAIVGPSTFTLYEVGTIKDVAARRRRRARRYVAVDGGMSDNIRPALYDADYSCTLASRASDAPPVLARVVGKHCESGDIVVRDEFLPGDVAPRRPARRRRGPAPTAAAWPATTTTCRGRRWSPSADGEARVIVRRETEDDLLALDVG